MKIDIEYDKGLNLVFLRNGNKILRIDRTEVEKIEKIFDAMDIPIHRKIRRNLYI